MPSPGYFSKGIGRVAWISKSPTEYLPVLLVYIEFEWGHRLADTLGAEGVQAPQLSD